MQTCFATEAVIERIARELGLEMRDVQELNFIKDGEMTILQQPITGSTLGTVWNTLLSRSQYSQRLDVVRNYNNQNLFRKRGLSICPVKYGIIYEVVDTYIKTLVNPLTLFEILQSFSLGCYRYWMDRV